MFRETSLARSQSKYERKYVDFIIYICKLQAIEIKENLNCSISLYNTLF